MRTPPNFLMELLSFHGITDPTNGRLTKYANESYKAHLKMAFEDAVNQTLLHKHNEKKYEAPDFATWYAKWAKETPTSRTE